MPSLECPPPQRMDRVKVSDKFSFPLALNMGPVIGQARPAAGSPGAGVAALGSLAAALRWRRSCSC